MKSPVRSFVPHPSLALAGLLLALAGLCSAQSPQVLVYDSGSDDRGQAVTTDATGAIIVGARSGSGMDNTFAILKYNAAGTLQWLARAQNLGDSYTGLSASDVTTDAAGNIYAVGSASKALPFLQFDYGWLVASYTPAGTQRWAQLVNGANSSTDRAYAAALHPAQGLYVTGITSGAFGRSDWLTIKYSLDGTEQWRRIEPGAGNTEDQPAGVKADAAGNAVVAGFMETSQGGPRNLRVIKYDPAGNVLWRVDYSAGGMNDVFPNALALDATGNIYVVADVGTLSGEDPTVSTTLKYDPNGNLLFVLSGPGQGGSSVAVDGGGNFIVSGTSVGPVGSNVIEQTSKFTSSGTPLWSYPLSTLRLAVDDLDGSVYLTRNYTVTKLNSSGALQWQSTVPQGALAADSLVDPASGALVVTGGSSTSSGGNIVTARFAAGSTPPPPPPPVPAAPSGLSASARKGAVTINWTDNANNETGFRIERASGSGAFVEIAQVAANVRTFDNTGLGKGVTYTYRVRAFNANGNSAYSNAASGTPK